jgi:hypothetical protein
MLQQQVTAAGRHISQPSANTNAGVPVGTGYSTGLGMFDIRHSSEQQENVCEAGTSENVHVFNANVSNTNGSDAFPACASGRCSTSQWHDPLLNELTLPTFSDSSDQIIANFLDELDKYFCLKGVPDPDEALTYTINTDASGKAIESLLMQTDREGYCTHRFSSTDTY